MCQRGFVKGELFPPYVQRWGLCRRLEGFVLRPASDGLLLGRHRGRSRERATSRYRQSDTLAASICRHLGGPTNRARVHRRAFGFCGPALPAERRYLLEASGGISPSSLRELSASTPFCTPMFPGCQSTQMNQLGRSGMKNPAINAVLKTNWTLQDLFVVEAG